MNMTPDLQKKAGAVAGFVLLAGIILYLELPHGGSAPPPAAPAPVVKTVPVQEHAETQGTAVSREPVIAGGAAEKVGSTAAQLDPTLHMRAMLVTESVVYSGGGRNIFSASSAPVDIPKPVAPVRTNGKGAVQGPPPAPSGPPPPPPIDLKFFGTATSENGARRALLLHGDDVFLASNGDIVQRRYKVISVAANSIVVEDLANNNRQTLPLLTR